MVRDRLRVGKGNPDLLKETTPTVVSNSHNYLPITTGGNWRESRLYSKKRRKMTSKTATGTMSVLAVISKLIERMVSGQLYAYLIEHDLQLLLSQVLCL